MSAAAPVPGPATTGLLVVFAKCNKPAAEAEWEQWYDEVHLPDLFAADTPPDVATRWVLSPKPEPGMPGVGFSHVTIYEFSDEACLDRIDALLAADDELRRAARIHPTHAVMDAQVLVAHGPWSHKPPPSPELRGHILAWVMSNDPAWEAEWDDWYDREHVPDMLDSEAFAAATRWRRAPRNRFGPNHLTLYDVAHERIETAVELSAAVMPAIVAAGRKHPAHTGGLTLTVVPTGLHGGTGFRG